MVSEEKTNQINTFFSRLQELGVEIETDDSIKKDLAKLTTETLGKINSKLSSRISELPETLEDKTSLENAMNYIKKVEKKIEIYEDVLTDIQERISNGFQLAKKVD